MGNDMFEILSESITQEWLRLVGALPRLLIALILLGLSVVAGRTIGRTVVRLLPSGRLAPTHISFFRGLVVWAFIFAGVLLALNVLGWSGPAAGLLAGGGVTAIALGFAFRGIGENLLAGLFLAFSRPFELGDLIESGAYRGKVRGIELRYTHVRTDDGGDVFIPSSQIFNEPLVNFTRDGLRRGAFEIGIDYRDDAASALAALLAAVRGTDGVLTDPPPVVSINTLTSNHVELQVRFWVDTFRDELPMVAVRTAVMDECRRALAGAGHTFSSEVTTAVTLAGDAPVDVRLDPAPPGVSRDGTPSR